MHVYVCIFRKLSVSATSLSKTYTRFDLALNFIIVLLLQGVFTENNFQGTEREFLVY